MTKSGADSYTEKGSEWREISARWRGEKERDLLPGYDVKLANTSRDLPTEMYLEPCQTPMIERFTKRSILDLWQSS